MQINFIKLTTLSLFFFIVLSYNPKSSDYEPLTKESNDEIEAIFNQFILKAESASMDNIYNDDFNTSTSCKVCRGVVDALRGLVLEKYGVQGFYKVMTMLCSQFMDEDVCAGAIGHYGDIVLDSLIRRGLDSERVCHAIKMCSESIPFIHIDDYAKRVLADKPEIAKENIDVKSLTSPELKAIQVTDLHLDLEYKEGTVVDCGRPLCCHDLPTNVTNTTRLAGLYGSIGSCDANVEIVKAFAEKAKELEPDMILFTGDNIAHSVWKVTQQEVIEATKVAIDAIVKEVGPNVPIYPAIGNHEKAPVDEFYGEEKELLNGLAEIFKPYLTEEAYDTFSKYGYYTMLYKDTNIRIVSLNCILCDSFNWNLIFDASQAKKMYDWFEGVLRQAEMNNEIVYLLDHISLGNSQHTVQCGLRLKVLMDRFEHIIKGHISGHSHNEQIRIVRSYDNTRTTNINHIASGLTTYTEYNPSFRMYLIDSETGIMKDFIQYRFHLEEANKKREPIWYESYKATTFFNVTSMNDYQGLSNITIEGDYIVKKYTDTEKGKQVAYNAGEIKSSTCDYKYDLLSDQMKCKNIKMGFSGDYMHYVLNLLMGEWRED